MTDAAPTPPGSAEHDTLTPGTIFAGHWVEGAIGRGGMGIVYRARHLSLDRERALKVVAPQLSADQRFRERFIPTVSRSRPPSSSRISCPPSASR